jgi:hypothetical protein
MGMVGPASVDLLFYGSPIMPVGTDGVLSEGVEARRAQVRANRLTAATDLAVSKPGPVKVVLFQSTARKPIPCSGDCGQLRGCCSIRRIKSRATPVSAMNWERVNQGWFMVRNASANTGFGLQLFIALLVCSAYSKLAGLCTVRGNCAPRD